MFEVLDDPLGVSGRSSVTSGTHISCKLSRLQDGFSRRLGRVPAAMPARDIGILLSNLLGSVQLMKVLQSDDPDVGIDKSGSRSHAVLKGLRGRSLTIGWAAAVLVATASWLYFVARASWFFVDWLLQ